jgi:flagellar motor switch protein FliG
MSDKVPGLSGARKAAILLVILGDEVSSLIYKNLPEEDLRAITQEISDLSNISPEIAAAVLEEYHRLTLTQDYLVQGGPEYASRLLIKAFGEAGAKTLLDQVTQAQEVGMRNISTLQKADPEQLAKFIQGEHPQTIALVLGHLSGKAASAVLVLLPEKLRAQVVMRLAQMQQFSPEMVQKISLILRRKMTSMGEQSRRGLGGVKAVADILNAVDVRFSTAILEAVEHDSPQLAVSIRDFMFTFQDFLDVPETSLRELLGQMDKRALAVALKGASTELKEHFFKCMSVRAVEMLKEDMEALGATRSRDVNQARLDAITLARKLETQGKMVLKNESEDTLVV